MPARGCFFLYSRMRVFSWSCEADVPSFFQIKEGTKEGGGEEEEEVEGRRERGKEDRRGVLWEIPVLSFPS